MASERLSRTDPKPSEWTLTEQPNLIFALRPFSASFRYGMDGEN